MLMTTLTCNWSFFLYTYIYFSPHTHHFRVSCRHAVTLSLNASRYVFPRNKEIPITTVQSSKSGNSHLYTLLSSYWPYWDFTNCLCAKRKTSFPWSRIQFRITHCIWFSSCAFLSWPWHVCKVQASYWARCPAVGLVWGVLPIRYRLCSVGRKRRSDVMTLVHHVAGTGHLCVLFLEGYLTLITWLRKFLPSFSALKWLCLIINLSLPF